MPPSLFLGMKLGEVNEWVGLGKLRLLLAVPVFPKMLSDFGGAVRVKAGAFAESPKGSTKESVNFFPNENAIFY